VSGGGTRPDPGGNLSAMTAPETSFLFGFRHLNGDTRVQARQVIQITEFCRTTWILRHRKRAGWPSAARRQPCFLPVQRKPAYSDRIDYWNPAYSR